MDPVQDGSRGPAPDIATLTAAAVAAVEAAAAAPALTTTALAAPPQPPTAVAPAPEPAPPTAPVLPAPLSQPVLALAPAPPVADVPAAAPPVAAAAAAFSTDSAAAAAAAAITAPNQAAVVAEVSAAFHSSSSGGGSSSVPAATTALSTTEQAATISPSDISTFSAAAAAAGVSIGGVFNGRGIASGTKTASAPKRKRLLRLEGGELVVIPTNIYKQAGGVKLDITLGGFRIDNEKCTLKNRAYNFGVLAGFTRENLLALSAFRDTLLPTDRLTPASIHTVIAAEAITRYDEEHQKPPEASSLAEESSYYGVGGWIPDSRVIHMTFAGSNMELRVKAGDLRAIDRPLQCKMALEALKSDPKVLAGKLEPAPPAVEVYGTGGTDTVGPEPGATGFSRAPEPFQPASAGSRSGSKGALGGGIVGGVGGEGASRSSSFGGASAEFFSLFGGVTGFGDGGGGSGGAGDDFEDEECDDLDSTPRHRRKKKKKKKTVVIPAVAGEGERESGAAAVEYDLPYHVQSVEGKQCSPSLRLKVPLSGFLVNGEDVPASELMVANGLDVTKENLLALRACRDAVLANFAGPDLVKRVVAGEVFRVWTKRRGEGAWASRRAEAVNNTIAMPVSVLPTAPVVSSELLLPLGGGGAPPPQTVIQPVQQQPQQLLLPTNDAPSTEGVVPGSVAAPLAAPLAAPVAAPVPGALPAAAAPMLSAAEVGAEYAGEIGVGSIASGGMVAAAAAAASSSHLVVTPATTTAAATARIVATPAAAGGGGVVSRPQVYAVDDVVTLSSPASFPGGPRIELRMTVGELRKARQTRVAELKRLVAAMLQDPKVQAEELEVVHEMSSPAITRKNLSGAAAAAAAAEAAAVATRANSHTMALLSSGQEERDRAGRGFTNGGGSGVSTGVAVGSKVAEKWGATLLQRGKRARAATGGVDVVNGGGGAWAAPSQFDASGGVAVAAAGGGVVSMMPTTAASSQRRQLWALAIRENELRYERDKEDARVEYDARQKELLGWMIDEEAGRHDALGGDAGPPPAPAPAPAPAPEPPLPEPA